MNSLIGLTPKALRKAADLQERIAALQEQLEQLLGEVSAPTAEAPKKRKKFSAATKAKMRASQKARWAGIRGTAPEAKPEPQKKAKKKMSAKGLANIRAGVAKRMAKRAAKAKL